MLLNCVIRTSERPATFLLTILTLSIRYLSYFFLFYFFLILYNPEQTHRTPRNIIGPYLIAFTYPIHSIIILDYALKVLGITHSCKHISSKYNR
jgi:hypothetical protein